MRRRRRPFLHDRTGGSNKSPLPKKKKKKKKEKYLWFHFGNDEESCSVRVLYVNTASRRQRRRTPGTVFLRASRDGGGSGPVASQRPWCFSECMIKQKRGSYKPLCVLLCKIVYTTSPSSSSSSFCLGSLYSRLSFFFVCFHRERESRHPARRQQPNKKKIIIKAR